MNAQQHFDGKTSVTKAIRIKAWTMMALATQAQSLDLNKLITQTGGDNEKHRKDICSMWVHWKWEQIDKVFVHPVLPSAMEMNVIQF